MKTTARERLARLFAGAEPAGSFSAQMTAPAQVLELEVSGAGRVRLPVRAPMAKKLIAVARPAMFGRGEKTLTDTSVRDTWELTPDQFTLGGSGWTALLDGVLEHFRDELGLPRRTRLRAEPHSMLVYGKGQFFLPHQDSEKHDAMIATLVVSLPSVHTGGELVIDHAGESRSYRASREDLTLVAFYSDCRHEVTPVRSGYRLTLTFNLLADTGTSAPDAGPVTEMADCLAEHFATPATSRFGGRDLDPPNRLVFLLDHEYTQRGLGWRRLKGVDADRAASLRAAAERAGCETVLALAEVKETWDVEPSGGYQWNGYYDEDDTDPDDYQLTDLIDDEITLGWWTRPDSMGGESISLHVRDHEVCATTPSKALEPYESEYEGYMGNYGNTLDRWYRRAAIVMWPRERAFAARAEAGSQWALHELHDRIEAGDWAGARAAAELLAPFWHRAAPQAGLLDVLGVAAGLRAAGTATMLLEPFRVETLTQEHAAGLAAAAGRYGEKWTQDVINGWFGQRRQYGTDRREWVEGLPGLCEALRVAGRPEVARLLTAGTWRWLHDELRTWTATARTDIRRPQLEQLSSPLVRLLDAAGETQREEISAALRGCADTVVECLMPALRSVASRRTSGFDEIARDCAQRLAAILAQPQREDDDWSIAWTGCRCELCDMLGTFLGSRTQRTFEWPLAKDGRRHVHTQIDSADLTVRHQTRRQGRPYTLVLTKTDELFTRAATARRNAEADLAWLTATWDDVT
ncbi:2OG-Fe(II) oxygenase [Amycolatopsis panacis]|uniref:2OG-Fe(II) oxygenase n=1 Tax=Amycolatopsis panacis TaxID=2340917 RepID=A0A419I9Y8_9PSEU|nr:2OG-Fe(II) oxygenase [Amycolatopsis panacis]RJQ89316.1 2OG-Fe(II) oxygenase [Amycolatopsis panacis]